MNNLILGLGCLLVFSILIAGCSKYADPELEITSELTRISGDPVTNSITYDVLITATNTGTNNAYRVRLLTILSTPKSLPEYRFVSANIDAGDIEKRSYRTYTQQLVLQATKANYDLIMNGAQEAEVETKVSSMSSNVMG